MRFWLPLTALLLPLVSAAGPASYKCKIEMTYTVSETGTLEGRQWPLGGEFMVDRRNGSIVGDYVSNANASSVKVVYSGDESYSFTVTSIFFGKTAEMLKVQEYAEGKTKPFVVLSQTQVITGTCE